MCWIVLKRQLTSTEFIDATKNVELPKNYNLGFLKLIVMEGVKNTSHGVRPNNYIVLYFTIQETEKFSAAMY